MEQFVPTILSFLLFLLVILKVVTRERFNSTPKLPPGPWKLPVLGNLHNLTGSLPHHRLRDLANKYGPLMHLQLGELSHIVVSSPEIAQEMVKTHDVNFSQRPYPLAASIFEIMGIVFAPYGDYWKKVRKICSEELLRPSRVKSFRSIREEEVSNLIRYLYSNAGVSINLSKKIFSMTYAITAKAAFGKKCKNQKNFISAVNEGQEFVGSFSLCELFPSNKWLQWIFGITSKLEEIFQTTDRIFGDIIKECEAEMAAMNDKGGKASSLLGVLLNIKEDGDLELPLKTENIRDILTDIFVAGSDTSSITLEWAMVELIKNPRVMKKAQAEVRQVFGSKEQVDETGLHELKFLSLVIKETLRLHPPAPFLVPRETKESCALNGYHIPAKTKVLVNAWAIGRDPRYWTEAEKFYPERFIDSAVDFKGSNFELIPFGVGRRICPGISFAMANIELPLAQLLYHFDWKLPHGIDHKNLDMTERYGLLVKRKEDLHLIPVPRTSVPSSS